MRSVSFRTLVFSWLGILFFSLNVYSQEVPQVDGLAPDPQREKMFLPYLAARHGGPENLEIWKSQNHVRYYQELWYFCESFYIKKDHSGSGVALDESIIDITRFESHRKSNERVTLELPGFKDAIVLLSGSELKYLPKW